RLRFDGNGKRDRLVDRELVLEHGVRNDRGDFLSRRFEDVRGRLVDPDDARRPSAEPNESIERRDGAEEPPRDVDVEDDDGNSARQLGVREPAAGGELTALNL